MRYKKSPEQRSNKAYKNLPDKNKAMIKPKTEFDVILANAGDKKIGVIKEIRGITGLGLKEAKELADNGGVIKEGASKEEAAEIKAKLEAAGATVEVK